MHVLCRAYCIWDLKHGQTSLEESYGEFDLESFVDSQPSRRIQFFVQSRRDAIIRVENFRIPESSRRPWAWTSVQALEPLISFYGHLSESEATSLLATRLNRLPALHEMIQTLPALRQTKRLELSEVPKMYTLQPLSGWREYLRFCEEVMGLSLWPERHVGSWLIVIRREGAVCGPAVTSRKTLRIQPEPGDHGSWFGTSPGVYPEPLVLRFPLGLYSRSIDCQNEVVQFRIANN